MSSFSICIDASVVVQLVTGGAYVALITDLWTAWRETRCVLMAPTLLYCEVTNALHRYVVQGYLLPEEAAEALDAALGLDITLHGDAELYRHALRLAERFSLPATYDAHYLALAEQLGAEFWTADGKLARAVQAALPWVRLVGE